MTETKDLVKIDRLRETKKQCAICGKGFSVKIFHDGKYTDELVMALLNH